MFNFLTPLGHDLSLVENHHEWVTDKLDYFAQNPNGTNDTSGTDNPGEDALLILYHAAVIAFARNDPAFAIELGYKALALFTEKRPIVADIIAAMFFAYVTRKVNAELKTAYELLPKFYDVYSKACTSRVHKDYFYDLIYVTDDNRVSRLHTEYYKALTGGTLPRDSIAERFLRQVKVTEVSGD